MPDVESVSDAHEQEEAAGEEQQGASRPGLTRRSRFPQLPPIEEPSGQ